MIRLAPPGMRQTGFALAVVVFVWSWVFLGQSFYAHKGSSDAIWYQPYALNMRAGQLPYRDFSVEYPPGALAAFMAPSYVGNPENLASYEKWFGRLMGVLGLCSLLLIARARPPIWGLALVAVSPLLIGTLAPERYDLWPATLTVAGVVALLGNRHRLGWAALAAAFTAKVYPLALLPLAAAWTFRRRGSGELARCAAVGLAVTAAAFGPFVVLAPHGLWTSLWGQATRPVQIESLVGSYLIAFEHSPRVFSYATIGIDGHGTLLATAFLAQLATLLWIWIAFARGEARAERFVRYAAAAVCASIAFGRVFSPQYLIWLVALVALVRGYRGMVATAMLVVCFILTDLWYGTHRFDAYIATGHYAWLVLTRNLLAVALVFVLAAQAPPGWRRRSAVAARPVQGGS